MLKIGDTIRQLRTAHNYSQEDMAKMLGISLKAYTNIERNVTTHLTIPRLEQIAGVLKVNLIDLLGKKSNVSITNQNNGGSVIGNYYENATEALTHTNEKLSMENLYLKEKNQLLEGKIGNLKEIIALMKEKRSAAQK